MQFDYTALRGKMRRSGFTLLTLAGTIGISESQLCHKLKGHYPFKQSDIVGICDALGIKTKDIGKYFFCQLN